MLPQKFDPPETFPWKNAEHPTIFLKVETQHIKNTWKMQNVFFRILLVGTFSHFVFFCSFAFRASF